MALRIPDDPSALSFLLTGIVQVEPDRRQALLEAASAEERLRDIDALLDRELDAARRAGWRRSRWTGALSRARTTSGGPSATRTRP